MLIEMHMLKSFPPTNLNRDDSGAPKSCQFGGVSRGRISSQCQKHAWRTSDIFRSGPIGDLGIRTRKMPELVGNRLREKDVEEDMVEAVVKLLSAFGSNKEKIQDKDIGITQQIIFYAPQEMDALADEFIRMIEEGMTAKKIQALKAKDVQKTMLKAGPHPITLDIALFGRMVTSDAFKDVEAALQVAHAISTHRMEPETDYFTAVDDIIQEAENGESGAGMIGDLEYNACCYYFYACLDMDQLRENLSETEAGEAIAQAALPAILEALAFVNPTGKQNSFAGHALPEVLLVEKKQRKIPVSYANAFVEPARATERMGLVESSAQKLKKEVEDIDAKFGLDVSNRLWLSTHDYPAPEKAEVCASLPEMLKRAAQLVQE